MEDETFSWVVGVMGLTIIVGGAGWAVYTSSVQQGQADDYCREHGYDSARGIVHRIADIENVRVVDCVKTVLTVGEKGIVVSIEKIEDTLIYSEDGD